VGEKAFGFLSVHCFSVQTDLGIKLRNRRVGCGLLFLLLLVAHDLKFFLLLPVVHVLNSLAGSVLRSPCRLLGIALCIVASMLGSAMGQLSFVCLVELSEKRKTRQIEKSGDNSDD
jgi:hypothetical protein